jgi:hypothetical protein
MKTTTHGRPSVTSPTQPSLTHVPDDCRVARTTRANLLLIGTETCVEDIVRTLWSRDGLSRWRPGQPLSLPTDTGTVILHEVDQLTGEDQLRLSRWLEAGEDHAQVVSTATAPLLPRVEAGTFIDTLYYRLNTICVDVTT